MGPELIRYRQTLTTVLIDHILYITSLPTPRYRLLSSLLPHLNSLMRAYPIQSAGSFVEKLSLMYKNLKRGLSRGASHPEAKTWPGLPELSLLRLIGSVWSTSDLNHAVVSPTRVLMGAYLGLCRVRSWLTLQAVFSFARCSSNLSHFLNDSFPRRLISWSILSCT
jgi:nucleolar protein 14